jgi:hypothetical protein
LRRGAAIHLIFVNRRQIGFVVDQQGLNIVVHGPDCDEFFILFFARQVNV